MLIMLADSAAMRQCLPVLKWLDILLATAGVLLLLGGILRSHRRGAVKQWFRWPVRINQLQPEWIVVPLLLYFLLMSLMPIANTPAPKADISQRAQLLLADLISRMVVVSAALYIVHRKFTGGWQSFFRYPHFPRRNLVWGVLGLVIAYPLVWGVSEVSLAIMNWWQDHPKLPEHPVLIMLADKSIPPWAIPVLWISAVAVTPLAEEVFFRGYCQTGLNHLFKNPAYSVGLTAVFFGLAHAQQPQFVAPMMVLGAALGYLYERTGGLLAPVVMHVLFNLKTMIYFSLGVPDGS